MNSFLHLEDVLHDLHREDDFLEIPLAESTFKFFIWFLLVSVGVMAVQLTYLALFQGEKYSARALANMSDTKIEHAPRGIIYDRFGKPLLRNEPTFEVSLIPKLLSLDSDVRVRTIQRATEILNLDMQEVYKRITSRNWGANDRVVLANDITQEQLVIFSSEELPGVAVESSFKRVHSDPYAFSHVLGYVGLVNSDDIANNVTLALDDEVGRAGLEGQYNNALKGVNGKHSVFRNAHGDAEDEIMLVPSRQGNSVHTFIDKELQEYMYAKLQATLQGLGRNVGIGIAVNPQNGEVLSLVNIPGFRVDRIGDALRSPFQPLFNRAISGRYNPGSTIKPLVALAALVEKVVGPETNIYSKGYIEIPNPYTPDMPSRFVDWKPHGWVNLASALARSSNVYFYEVGGGFQSQQGIGIAKLKEWWQKFGLGEKTNIDIPYENTGFLPDPEWKEKTRSTPWRIGDTYHVAIGQGDFSVTPIALLNYIAAIANGGILYTPRIMEKIIENKDTIVLQSTSSVVHDVSSLVKDAILEVQNGMIDAVEKPYGTAHPLHDLPVSVAGKTGTAQIENNAKTNAFFVGYSPVKNPQIALLILVENAREGSLNTVPLAKDIFLWYYEHRLTHI